MPSANDDGFNKRGHKKEVSLMKNRDTSFLFIYSLTFHKDACTYPYMHENDDSLFRVSLYRQHISKFYDDLNYLKPLLLNP